MNKGMTLLEILISLAIFAFASLYIARILNQSLSQKKKIDREVKEQRITSNILEILKQDLIGTGLFSDISFQLQRRYPLSANTPPRPLPPVSFDFQGKSDQLHFTTFSKDPAKPQTQQLIKVGYRLQNCTSANQKKTSQCLMRGVSPYWEKENDLEKMKWTPLFENLEELEFSYYHPVEKEWKREWNSESIKQRAIQSSHLELTLLPSTVRLAFAKNNRKKEESFPVSHAFLRTRYLQTLSPFLAFEDFKEEETKKEKREDETPPPDKEKGHEDEN